ncbi:MAG: leucine--tRNA ligase [Patescibacteria group bacterium]
MARYDHKKVEAKRQKRWVKEGVYEPNLPRRASLQAGAKKPFYNLMMFPYPSAEGLHVGNMYAFTGSDIYGRFKRMQGYDVFEPIGLDGFGIHSENYALKIGVHPATQAKVSEKRFYKQLVSIGNGFAWNERLETYDPEYYRWTQWIFTRMFKAGLAYRKRQEVNWCPSCKTVLADEQVEGGVCERCKTQVIKKELEQWFFGITKYAERLLRNLPSLDWSDNVKIAQRNWIGRSEGALIAFDLNMIPGQPDGKHKVQIFTTRPDTMFGATFMVVSPELAQQWLAVGWQADAKIKKYVADVLAKRRAADKETSTKKTGIFSGIYAVNPANKDEIPVWISDYVLGDVGTGAIMAVPAHDQRDFDFARAFNISIKMVVQPPSVKEGLFSLSEAYEGEGVLVNSEKFNGMRSEEAKKAITEQVGGKTDVRYRLRDWLISRQRYWGPPIPMIYCEACAARKTGERADMPGWYAVPEGDLPVKLPLMKDFRPSGTGVSPLASAQSFSQVKCPACGAKARRETDVSDTFLDSAWYYLRYIDVANTQKPFDKARTEKWLPVDMYIGGSEHAVLHLLYVRFVAMVLKDWGLIDCEEPFKKFRAHGLLIKEGAKMSKSRGNVVNPDEYIKRFGADALRMYLMFLAPFEQGGDFRDQGMAGITRFLERVWRCGTAQKFVKMSSDDVRRAREQAVKKVTEDIEALRYNTAVSALMICLNAIEEHGADKETCKTFLKLMAPFAPHMADELWERLGGKKSIHREPWPVHDEALVREETFDLVVQVNGKVRAVVKAQKGIAEAQAAALAHADANAHKFIIGTIKKTIFVKDRLINFIM